MRVLYRTTALLLTLLSAGIFAVLVSVAIDDNRQIRVVNFTLLALVAAVLLSIALALWSRTIRRDRAR